MSLRCWKYLYLVWNLFFFFFSSFYGGKFIFWFICMHSKVLILNDLCFSCLQKSVPCHKSIEILFCIFLLKVLKFCLSHYTCNWFFFMVWGGGLFSFFSLGTHHMFADLLGNSLMLEKPSQGRLGHRAPAVSYGRRGICHPKWSWCNGCGSIFPPHTKAGGLTKPEVVLRLSCRKIGGAEWRIEDPYRRKYGFSHHGDPTVASHTLKIVGELSCFPKAGRSQAGQYLGPEQRPLVHSCLPLPQFSTGWTNRLFILIRFPPCPGS